MHDNHHLQSTEDSPPSVLEINLRIHAMRAYHTVRTIGVTASYITILLLLASRYRSIHYHCAVVWIMDKIYIVMQCAPEP